jgi:hypothetical protein
MLKSVPEINQIKETCGIMYVAAQPKASKRSSHSCDWLCADQKKIMVPSPKDP